MARPLTFPQVIGRSLDGLDLDTRWSLAGQWIAVERYSPDRLPLRVIAALGPSAAACAEQLQTRGLPPFQYEYMPVPEPYPA